MESIKIIETIYRRSHKHKHTFNNWFSHWRIVTLFIFTQFQAKSFYPYYPVTWFSYWENIFNLLSNCQVSIWEHHGRNHSVVLDIRNLLNGNKCLQGFLFIFKCFSCFRNKKCARVDRIPPKYLLLVWLCWSGSQ